MSGTDQWPGTPVSISYGRKSSTIKCNTVWKFAGNDDIKQNLEFCEVLEQRQKVLGPASGTDEKVTAVLSVGYGQLRSTLGKRITVRTALEQDGFVSKRTRIKYDKGKRFVYAIIHRKGKIGILFFESDQIKLHVLHDLNPNFKINSIVRSFPPLYSAPRNTNPHFRPKNIGPLEGHDELEKVIEKIALVGDYHIRIVELDFRQAKRGYEFVNGHIDLQVQESEICSVAFHHDIKKYKRLQSPSEIDLICIQRSSSWTIWKLNFQSNCVSIVRQGTISSTDTIMNINYIAWNQDELIWISQSGVFRFNPYIDESPTVIYNDSHVYSGIITASDSSVCEKDLLAILTEDYIFIYNFDSNLKERLKLQCRFEHHQNITQDNILHATLSENSILFVLTKNLKPLAVAFACWQDFESNMLKFKGPILLHVSLNGHISIKFLANTRREKAAQIKILESKNDGSLNLRILAEKSVVLDESSRTKTKHLQTLKPVSEAIVDDVDEILPKSHSDNFNPTQRVEFYDFDQPSLKNKKIKAVTILSRLESLNTPESILPLDQYPQHNPSGISAKLLNEWNPMDPVESYVWLGLPSSYEDGYSLTQPMSSQISESGLREFSTQQDSVAMSTVRKHKRKSRRIQL